MKVYGQINYTGTMKYQGSTLNLEYVVDDYRHGLTLTKGYIGGGYISNAGWTNVTTIQNATDAWGTSANASLRAALRYGGWFSSHVNGYMTWCDGNLFNQKMPFSTETCANIADRNYGSSNGMSQMQHGIGYNIDGSFYGTKGFTLSCNDSTNYDKLNFQTDSWTAASDGSIGTQTAYTQAWFDKDNGFSLGSNGYTKKYPFATETWGNITASPNYTLTLSAWGKGLPTKEAKSYVFTNNATYPFMKFMHLTYSYVTNPYDQTLNNGEQSPVMGQSHGYWAGGYNGAQNAHTDRVEYNTDTVINIPDAPRALSSGSPMWSGY
jgi:hypothetical protein